MIGVFIALFIIKKTGPVISRSRAWLQLKNGNEKWQYLLQKYLYSSGRPLAYLWSRSVWSQRSV